MIAISPDDARCDSAAQGAALGLLGLMSGISEEYYHAGWMQDLEYELWQAPPRKLYGQGVITERQSALLRLLSEECDGWWVWGDDGPTFVRLTDWKSRKGERENSI